MPMRRLHFLVASALLAVCSAQAFGDPVFVNGLRLRGSRGDATGQPGANDRAAIRGVGDRTRLAGIEAAIEPDITIVRNDVTVAVHAGESPFIARDFGARSILDVLHGKRRSRLIDIGGGIRLVD